MFCITIIYKFNIEYFIHFQKRWKNLNLYLITIYKIIPIFKSIKMSDVTNLDF